MYLFMCNFMQYRILIKNCFIRSYHDYSLCWSSCWEEGCVTNGTAQWLQTTGHGSCPRPLERMASTTERCAVAWTSRGSCPRPNPTDTLPSCKIMLTIDNSWISRMSLSDAPIFMVLQRSEN